jgi:hypothetical protein
MIMEVAKLIKILSQFPENQEVMICTDDEVAWSINDVEQFTQTVILYARDEVQPSIVQFTKDVKVRFREV